MSDVNIKITFVNFKPCLNQLVSTWFDDLMYDFFQTFLAAPLFAIWYVIH
jgi:hypothetical protein